MSGQNERTPAGRPGLERAQRIGDRLRSQYTASPAPASFWKGWRGPQDAAPAIHRRPAKPSGSLWRPEVRR